MRVIAAPDVTHYRGSEETRAPVPGFVWGLVSGLLRRCSLATADCVGSYGVGGCVLFEKCIVDASIKVIAFVYRSESFGVCTAIFKDFCVSVCSAFHIRVLSCLPVGGWLGCVCGCCCKCFRAFGGCLGTRSR